MTHSYPNERDVPPDTRIVAAGVTLSIIGGATFLLLPLFLEAVAVDLRFTEPQLGIVSALVATGATVANVAASLWMRRSAWRKAAWLSLLGLIATCVGSMFCRGFPAFSTLQFLGGLCSGSLYSLSMTALSDTRRPIRAFVYATAVQTAYQVFGLVAGPFLIHHGIRGVLWLLTGLCAGGTLAISSLPRHGRSQSQQFRLAGLLNAPVLFALVGCLLFFVNIGAYWTYIERLGRAANLSISAVSNSLGVATAASLGSMIFAWWLGNRRGILMPLALSAVGTVASMLLLLGTPGLFAYATSAVIYNNAWSLSYAYQYGFVHEVDTSGSGVAACPGFQGTGQAAGAALAALFVTEHNHASVLWLVNLSVLMSLGCFVLALRLRPRAAAPPQTSR
jgi:predicted MFS family arabinose efflux permease